MTPHPDLGTLLATDDLPQTAKTFTTKKTDGGQTVTVETVETVQIQETIQTDKATVKEKTTVPVSTGREGTADVHGAPNDQGYTIRPSTYLVEGANNQTFSNRLLVAFIVAPSAYLSYTIGLGLVGFFVTTFLLALPLFSVYFVLHSYFAQPPNQRTRLPGKPIEHYLNIKDSEIASIYHHHAKIPGEVFYEGYIAGKIDLAEGQTVIDLFEARHDWASFRLTLNQAKFFATKWIPELLWHSKGQDDAQVRDHYDRGDDFHQSFLGESMVYTSGIVRDTKNRETLEQLQENKAQLVCEKLRLKEGETHLDIGCGWGHLVCRAAQNYGTVSTGVTLCHNQVAWAEQTARECGVEDKTRFLRMDYRDIPATKYDKISCVEMAEHVGVRRFHAFLVQVRELMEDDGLFYMQVAGLRRTWQLEDLCWGLFMAKYVFPGADASTPLFWYINQLENAGFEVQTIDNIGIHYSATIDRWYHNWENNRDLIVARYGEQWWRIWAVFLAWSTIAARQGSAACFQMVATKNLNAFDRSKMISGKRLQA